MKNQLNLTVIDEEEGAPVPRKQVSGHKKSKFADLDDQEGSGSKTNSFNTLNISRDSKGG